MSEELGAVLSWYEKQWESKVRSPPQQELKKMNEGALIFGRAWRLGLAAQTFGASPKFEYYPGGAAGAPDPSNRKSERQNYREGCSTPRGTLQGACR